MVYIFYFGYKVWYIVGKVQGMFEEGDLLNSCGFCCYLVLVCGLGDTLR